MLVALLSSGAESPGLEGTTNMDKSLLGTLSSGKKHSLVSSCYRTAVGMFDAPELLQFCLPSPCHHAGLGSSGHHPGCWKQQTPSQTCE